jgi:hypothetical protein
MAEIIVIWMVVGILVLMCNVHYWDNFFHNGWKPIYFWTVILLIIILPWIAIWYLTKGTLMVFTYRLR